MKKIRIFSYALLLISITVFLASSQVVVSSIKIDAVIVLDNSGSMKKNDPQFLARNAVETFAQGFRGDVQIGIVIFADKSELAFPLTSISHESFSKNVEDVLQKLNYKGNYTDIPAGIERAIYELKQKGRVDASKVIIFMTDGIIDVGDLQKDKEKAEWLKNELLEDAKRNQIKIFAIAFTEEADYALIQTIASKTNGSYYRALKAEEIASVLEDIKKEMLEKPKSQEVLPTVETESSFKKTIAIVGIVLVAGILLSLIIIILVSKKKKPMEERLPEAYFESRDPRIGTLRYRIAKKQTTIGRQIGVDIHIDEPTISRVHGLIVYEGGQFYFIDQDSTNGTLIKNRDVTPREKVPIFGGDEIILDKKNKFKFVFITPGIGPAQIDETETTIIVSSPVSKLKTEPEKQPESAQSSKSPDETFILSEKKNLEDESPTFVKKGMCDAHPSKRNTGICFICGKEGCEMCINSCSICGKAFCKEHIREKEGKYVCMNCLEKS